MERIQKRVKVQFLDFFWLHRWTTFSDVPGCQLLEVVPFNLCGCSCSWLLHRSFDGDGLVVPSGTEIRILCQREVASSFSLRRKRREYPQKASLSLHLRDA